MRYRAENLVVGKGAPRDKKQASSWMRKAARAGDEVAMATLGIKPESDGGGQESR